MDPHSHQSHQGWVSGVLSSTAGLGSPFQQCAKPWGGRHIHTESGWLGWAAFINSNWDFLGKGKAEQSEERREATGASQLLLGQKAK